MNIIRTIYGWLRDKVAQLPIKKVFLGAFVVLILWYGLGLPLSYTIYEDLNDQPPKELYANGASKSVATAITLIEAESNRWSVNKPFIYPIWLSDNMPNYQKGMMYAVARFIIEMGDQLGRTRGSSAIDTDLDNAAGSLKYRGNAWYLSENFVPQIPAHREYLRGAESLRAYNQRLGKGQAVFDVRADNLLALLDRIGADLGSSSASLDERAFVSNSAFFDTQADDIFFETKGKLYAYYLILRDIKVDFQQIIEEKQVEDVYKQMLYNLKIAADLHPWIISNGSQDGVLFPSHLSAQGFYLLRARTQLKEVIDILEK